MIVSRTCFIVGSTSQCGELMSLASNGHVALGKLDH
jgi:hypothetical protein